MQAKPDHTVDLRDKQCPFTILELGKTLESAASGDLIEVILAGAAALDEIRIWCRKTGNEIEEIPEAAVSGTGASETAASEDQAPRIYVRKP